MWPWLSVFFHSMGHLDTMSQHLMRIPNPLHAQYRARYVGVCGAGAIRPRIVNLSRDFTTHVSCYGTATAALRLVPILRRCHAPEESHVRVQGLLCDNISGAVGLHELLSVHQVFILMLLQTSTVSSIAFIYGCGVGVVRGMLMSFMNIERSRTITQEYQIIGRLSFLFSVIPQVLAQK